MLATMKPLTAQRFVTYNLHPASGQNGFVSTSKREADLRSRKAQASTIRASLLSSPSPSSERRFETPSDSTIIKQIPRLEPFTQSRIVRGMREPSLLEKAEHAISDHCLALEGDEAYKCWEALFELEKMKEECKIERKSIDEGPRTCHPALERIEHLVRQSGGISSLIDNLLMLAKVFKIQNAHQNPVAVANSQDEAHTDQIEQSYVEEFERHIFPEPGCLPKTKEELQLEQSALMPESSFTRLLRRRGKLSSWFAKPPDHETD